MLGGSYIARVAGRCMTLRISMFFKMCFGCKNLDRWRKIGLRPTPKSSRKIVDLGRIPR
jgi:hypothetical protein